MTTASIIHVVVTDEFAGVERYLCGVAPRQAAQGHQVTVVGGDSTSMSQALGPGVLHVPGARLDQAVTALLRLGRADIVHAHMTNADIVAVATKVRTRARVISTRHFAGPRGSRAVVRTPLRVLARGIDAEIAISRFVAEATGEDLNVIPNGVPNSALGQAGQRERVVLVIQRLETEKDTATALRAFAESGLASDGWVLEIAGRGAQESELKRLAASLGITQSLRWLGFLADPDAARSRAAVHLATADAEPFGLAVAESMAQGLPVVASSGGAHPELLGPGARTFAVGDAVAAAGLLRDLADDPSSATTYGGLLRERQQELFDIERHVAQIQSLYDGVL